VSASRALELVPGLDPRGLTGAALWSDAQASSTERLTLAFVHAAADAGARVANHMEVVDVLRTGDRIAGVVARDTLDGAVLEVPARMVLNAAGPWVDEVLARAGLRHGPTPLLRARNLVLDRPASLPHAVGARSGERFLFLVPWQGRTLVGTDYEPAEDPPTDPREFLAECDRAFPWASLSSFRVTLVHEGLVPGRGGPAGLATRPRLHDHQVEHGHPGLVSVQGVKYTTARSVAEQAVDRVLRRLGKPFVPGRTAVTPLSRAGPLSGDLETRTRQAVRDEMAFSLADAILRRLDLGTAGAPSDRDLDVVTRVMTEELGWGARRAQREREALARTFPAF
jgi:glycerol-3-phosphate dehydrogenase